MEIEDLVDLFLEELVRRYRETHKAETEFLTDEEIIAAVPLTDIDFKAIWYTAIFNTKEQIQFVERKIADIKDGIASDERMLGECNRHDLAAELRSDIRDEKILLHFFEDCLYDAQKMLESLEKMKLEDGIGGR